MVANEDKMSDDEILGEQNSPKFITLSNDDSFLISSAKSNFDSPSEYLSLAIQRLRMLTGSFEKNQKQIYYLPNQQLLKFLWKNIIQCFREHIETNKIDFNSTDSDIIDLIQYLKECTWIFIEIPKIRKELYFGFEMSIIEKSENYNSRDKTKNFYIYYNSGTFVCNFLLSHILRNMEFTLARCLLSYYSNLFFEECLFNIENNLSRVSLLLYQKKYENEKHLMEHIAQYIEDLNEKEDIEYDTSFLNNIKCLSKLISSLYHCSENSGGLRRYEYKYIIYTQDKKDYIDINLKFKLLEYFFVPCVDEKSLCELMVVVFSHYILLNSSPSSLKDLFQLLMDRLKTFKIQNHTNSGGMTLACLYFLLSLSNSKYSHIITEIEPLSLTEQEFDCCKEYAVALFDNKKESKSFCSHVIELIKGFKSC